MFLPSDPPPLLLALPLLDSLPNAGIGGDSSSIGPQQTRQSIGQRLAYGQRFIVQGIDSPGMPFPMVHPAFGNPGITQCEMNQSYAAFLVVWSSMVSNSQPNNAPADRLYGLVLTQPWSITAAYNIAANGTVTDIGLPTISLDPAAAVSYGSAVALPTTAPIMIPPAILSVLTVNAGR
jgi:hypothetical protein